MDDVKVVLEDVVTCDDVTDDVVDVEVIEDVLIVVVTSFVDDVDRDDIVVVYSENNFINSSGKKLLKLIQYIII